MPSLNQLLVDTLLTDEGETTVDVLLHLKLFEKAHWPARAELDDTTICASLVHFMKHHPDCVAQSKACALLTNLTYYHKNNTVAFHRAHVTPIIVQSMDRFLDRIKLQQWAAAALCNLSLLPSYQTNVVQAGALEVLIAALTLHPSDAKLQTSGCNCFGILAKRDAAVRNFLRDEGIPVIRAARDRFADTDKDAHDAATKALLLLNSSTEEEENTKEDAAAATEDAAATTEDAVTAAAATTTTTEDAATVTEHAATAATEDDAATATEAAAATSSPP